MFSDSRTIETTHVASDAMNTLGRHPCQLEAVFMPEVASVSLRVSLAQYDRSV